MRTLPMKELKRQMVAISEQAALAPSLERSSGLLSWLRDGSIRPADAR